MSDMKDWKNSERFENIMDKFGFGEYGESEQMFKEGLGDSDEKEGSYFFESDGDLYYKCSECGFKGEAPQDIEGPADMPKDDGNWCPECGEYPQEFEKMQGTEEINEMELKSGEPGQTDPDDIEIGGDYSKDQYDQEWSKFSGNSSGGTYWYTCKECGTNGKVDLREGSKYECPDCESQDIFYHYGGEARNKALGLVTSLNEQTNGEVGKDFILQEAEKIAGESNLFQEFSNVLRSIDKEEIENQKKLKEGEKTDKYCTNCGWDGIKKKDQCPQCGSRLREGKQKEGENIDEYCKQDDCEQSDGDDGDWELRDHESGEKLGCYTSKEDCKRSATYGEINEAEEGQKLDIIFEGNKCPECSADLPEDCKYCPDCGHSLEESTVMQQKTMGEEGAQTCGECDASLPEGSKYCPQCGSEVEEQMLDEEREDCPECEAELPDGGCDYCPQCGCDIQESIQNMPLDESEESFEKIVKEWRENWKDFYTKNSSKERIHFFKSIPSKYDSKNKALHEMGELANTLGSFARFLDEKEDGTGFMYQTLQEELNMVIDDIEESGEINDMIQSLHEKVDKVV